MNKPAFIFISLFVAIPAFLLARVIWPLPTPPPEDLTLFLTLVSAVECLLLGFGISFVVFVLQKLKSRKKKFSKLDWATFISIAWILISGYPHDNNHLVHHGADLHDLVQIEIFFHGTLAAAAIVVAVYWLHKMHLDE